MSPVYGMLMTLGTKEADNAARLRSLLWTASAFGAVDLSPTAATELAALRTYFSVAPDMFAHMRVCVA